ncbi:hypothetical protein WJX84_006600 [Apatococcus fuscideae]|uniref:Nicotinamide-nucleotide adenylyltransferase n=1 Tax=Apatococcus fuscideae TaxID=2026836 RepID=A0AAW1TCN4_9CHLO
MPLGLGVCTVRCIRQQARAPALTRVLHLSWPGNSFRQLKATSSCGSFNPPTVMHLRMFDLARFALEEMGHQVVGAYMSPVNDAYKKANLAAGKHRVAMSHLAAEQLPYLQADGWEAEQSEYQRTVDVLKYFSQRQHPDMQESSTETARVMLLAGADLLETFLEPGIWSEEDQETILRDYGVVCITRATTAVEELLARPGTSLSRHRQNIHIVHEPITNDISATKIRRELALGHPVRFLVPDAVAAYIKEHDLYSSPDLKR